MSHSRRWFVRGLSVAPLLIIKGSVAWGRGFVVPDEAARAAAVGSLDGVPAALRPAFTAGPDDLPVATPGPDDWLGQHAEDGQSFARFKRERIHKPTDARRTIGLVPLGALDPSTPLPAILAFAERFFGMPVVQRLTQPIKVLHPQSRIHDGRLQYHTPSLLNALIKRVPEDAYCLIAVTQADLYPKPGWNFVFGEARLYERVGVYSFARYDPAFYGEARGPETGRQILRRSLKLMAHEVGHMFGVEHCIFYACVMNGTNHLEETDRSPLHLCPVCLRKLHDSVGFNILARERGLIEFFNGQGLAAEAAVHERRLARLVAAAG
jgi:archaemetzincin